MVAPIDAKWNVNTVSDGNLNKTTYGQGTSFPSTWPTDRLFWRTDLNLLFKNKGSEGTPIWEDLGSVGQGGDQLYPLSITIGDYSTPAAAVGSSEDYVTPIFSDDFSSYADQSSADTAWPSADTAQMRVNITNDNIDFNAIRGSNDSIVHFLGSGAVSNLQFRLKFKLVISALNQQSLQSQVFIGLSDKDQTAGEATTQDFIGLVGTLVTGTASWAIRDTDNTGLAGAADATFSHGLTTETIWVKIERTSATAYTVSMYSDSTYTTLIESQSGTCASTTQALNYICIRNNQSATSSSSITGTVDDIVLDYKGLDDLVFDTSTTLKWKSTSENNPSIYIDTGSAQEIVGLAIHLDRTETTETEIDIRVSTDTSFDSTEDVRSISITDFTDDTWRFIMLPRLSNDRRYVQIRGVGTSKVLAINEIKYRVKTTAAIDREHYHEYLNPNSVNSNGEDSN